MFLNFIKDDSMLFSMLKIDKKKIEADAEKIFSELTKLLENYNKKLDKLIELMEAQNAGK